MDDGDVPPTDAAEGDDGSMPERPLSIHELDGVVLTANQGFQALALFLRSYADRTQGMGAIATVLGDVELESNGISTDPAALSDWLGCVRRVVADPVRIPADGDVETGRADDFDLEDGGR